METAVLEGGGPEGREERRRADLGAIRRVRAGDPEAFGELVAAHSRTVYRIAWRIVGEGGAAEDAVQETFLRAYRFLDRFDDRAEFGTWIHRIAVNAAIDELRKHRRERTFREDLPPEEGVDAPPIPSTEPAPDRVALSSELGRAVRAALGHLSADERAAFVLRHFEGRSIAEIGATLGKRENATKQSIFRAVRKLRRTLAPLMETSHEAAL
jgi:RNA polymerase sigma-70 factor (ECF subfamily)